MSELLEQTQRSGNRRTPKGYYAQEFIMEVVKAMNEGLPPREAQERYGVVVGTLSGWMQKYGSEQWRQRRKLPVPRSVKSKVVRAIEQGQMTVREAQVAYNIKSSSTIRQWKKELKEENADLVGTNHSVMKARSPENKAVNTSLPPDVKGLQKALQEAELKIAALNMLIDVAEEQLKINIRKKPGAKQ